MNREEPGTIAANLDDVRRRIAHAAIRCGRDISSISLLAVSKFVPLEAICEAIGAGQVLFGENYVQEARKKIGALEELGDKLHKGKEDGSLKTPERFRFHLIGPLQKNKVKHAVRVFDVIQTVDRLDLAETISHLALRLAHRQKILVQVNISEEETKRGVMPADTVKLCKTVNRLPSLELKGLMAIGHLFSPEAPDAERRSELRKLAGLKIQVEDALGHALPELSMGMSHDFELAIEEGATIVRVGTAIFGERDRSG